MIVLHMLLRALIKPPTAAPADDEQSVFGREEGVRLDEEVMDFRRFDTVTWDSIKDLRGTTWVQSPPRFKFALQHAILRVVQTDSTFDEVSFFLMLKPQAHNFSLVHLEIILEFICETLQI